VHLVGAPKLTQLYAIGLAKHDVAATSTEGEAASVAGLAQLHRQLTCRQVADAAR
jgi:2-keto-3-deoxy-galactonokinase